MTATSVRLGDTQAAASLTPRCTPGPTARAALTWSSIRSNSAPAGLRSRRGSPFRSATSTPTPTATRTTFAPTSPMPMADLSRCPSISVTGRQSSPDRHHGRRGKQHHPPDSNTLRTVVDTRGGRPPSSTVRERRPGNPPPLSDWDRGVGGAGMLATEFLSRLGVGELVVVDSDKVEITNLTRLPGALRRDARAILTHPDRPRWARKLGGKIARVITLNGIAVSNALTRLTLALTGLNSDEPIAHHRVHPRRDDHAHGEPARDSGCTVCGIRGITGLEDLRPLPLPRN